MSTPQNTPAKSPKTPLSRRIFALFLMLLFIAVGGGIIFFAKNTAHDLSLIPTPSPSATSADSAAKTDSKLLAIPDLSPENMVVVEKSAPDTAPAATAQGMTDDGRSVPDTPPLDSDISNLKMQLRDLEIRLAEKSGSAKAATELSESLSTLQKEVLALTEKVAKLEQIAIAASEASKRGIQNDMALLLAISNLQGVIASGQPYEDSLAMVQNFAHDNSEVTAAIAPLSAGAKTGISAPASIQNDFQNIARQILQASAKNRAADWAAGWVGDGMIAGGFGTIASLITIRHKGDGASAEDGSLESHIDAIEQSLTARQWSAAIEKFNQLPAESIGDAARQWQKRVTDRQSAELAMANLQKMVLSRLQSGSVTN